MLADLSWNADRALDLWCQTALWLGACLLLVRCWTGASAARRQFVWTLALAGLVLLPALQGRLPAWSLWTASGSPPGADAAHHTADVGQGPLSSADVARRGLSASRSSGPGTSPGPGLGDGLPALRGADQGVTAALADPTDRALTTSAGSGTRASAPGEPGPQAWLGLIGLAGALVVLAPLLLGGLLAWRWAARARPAPADEVAAAARRLGLSRPPRVLVGAQVPAPLTCGLLRPLVLLPAAWSCWPAARRQLVLLHELAHVARGDAAALTVGRLGLAVAWWQPLAWLAFAALRRETEQACDDRVLASDPRADAEYARCLVEVAREGRAPAWVASLCMARASRLEQRLVAILDEQLPRRDVSGRLRLGGLSLAALVLGTCAGLDVLAAPVAAAPALSPAGEPALVVPAAPVAAELIVKLDGSGTHATLAEALVAASAGDVIRLGPGTHVGGQRVEVAVTLVGAGAGETVLAATWAVDEALARDLEARFREADDAEREVLRVEARDRGTPVVLDLRVPGITVEALTVSHPGVTSGSGIRQGAAVRVLAADTVLRRVAVVQTLGSGVQVDGDAGLVMEDCLVARCQATGVAIGPGVGRVELRRCDVRDGYHRGVTIGRDDVLVEGCRISGSAWHGIRYDGCSPTLRGNALFANERFGIYASGTTAALVEGNLFVENGMAGMGCWFRNGDTLRGNTFVGDQRTSLEVLGRSRPTVEANVFAWAPVAVSAGNIGGSSPDAASEGLPALAGNLAFGCGAVATSLGDTVDAESLGVLQENPGFVDAPGRDFRLLAEGAAALAGLGASAPPSLTSPWPIQPGERPDAPSLGAAPLDTAALSPPPAVDAYELSQVWIDALHGEDDGARFAAVEALRRALLSDDDVQAHAGLLALQRSADVAFERDSLRPHLEALARRLEGPGRVSAFYVLGLLGPSDVDRDLLHAAVAAPDDALRHSASHLLSVYHRGDLRDPTCEALLLDLLDTSDRGDLREVFRGLWGARISAPVVARVLEHSETAAAYDALYYTLSTLPEKSEAVVARLLRELSGADAESIDRVCWGLRTGVSASQRPAVIAQLLLMLEHPEPTEQREAWMRSTALELLGWLGDAEVLPRVEQLVDGEGVHPAVSQAAREAARRLRQRLGLPARD